MACRLKYDEKFTKRKAVQYFEFEEPRGELEFTRIVTEYSNALINSNGGFIVFGVLKGKVKGIYLSRDQEDQFRLIIDRQLRSFEPAIGPNSYRVTVTELERPHMYCVMEIRIAAGPLGCLYQTSDLEVFAIKNNHKVGPLWPQELKAFVIEKYHEEMGASKSLSKSPARPDEKENTDRSEAKG